MNKLTCSEHSVHIRRSKKCSTGNQPLRIHISYARMMHNAYEEYAKNMHDMHKEYGYHTQGLCITYAKNTHIVYNDDA